MRERDAQGEGRVGEGDLSVVTMLLLWSSVLPSKPKNSVLKTIHNAYTKAILEMVIPTKLQTRKGASEKEIIPVSARSKSLKNDHELLPVRLALTV